jgi:hypothetical protein
MAQPFYLGLNMSGTVSAGAYTAGVIDFLVEAMDAWYSERVRQIEQFGTNYDEWTILPHELELAVMAGASGGGITAALTAAALSQSFTHVRTQSPIDDAPVNTLFQSWVRDIDLAGLLGHADLDASGGRVESLLDSSPIREIASKALRIFAPLNERRPWVRDGLKVILTLTNLRGIPYAIESETAASERTLYYADQRDFEVLWAANPTGLSSISLNATGGGEWTALAEAAIATSAFPVVLAPQTLARTAAEYNERRWWIQQADTQLRDGGICECQKNEPMPPAWNLANASPLETLNVDGGATNNSPFDCARFALAGIPPVLPSGRNPRDPRVADRAIISIAPLSTETASDLPAMPRTALSVLLTRFIAAVVNQSRIQGENLKLTPEASVASRWIIAPNSIVPNTEPLAGSLLQAFGGFVARVFREHDYQLGRRNCQWFLRSHFGLPWDNAIMRQYSLSTAARERLDARFGFSAAKNEPSSVEGRLFPVIPVLPELVPEITVSRNAIDQKDLKDLGELAVDRVKRVAKALLTESGAGVLSDVAFDGAWLFIKPKLRDRLLNYAGFELARQGFVK